MRSRFLWRDSCFEKFLFVNHGLEELEVPGHVAFDADYTDVFEVRGTVRERRGRRLEEQIEKNSVTLSYEGLDHVVRQTCIRSDANSLRTSETASSLKLAFARKRESPYRSKSAAVPIP